MWHDIETEDDYLNFGMIVDSVYNTIIEQVDDDPLSFGISGSWGTGKSSFAKQLKKRFQRANDYIVCDFNAWLYQGFEDSKIALLKVVANAIVKCKPENDNNWKHDVFNMIEKIKQGKKFANAAFNIIPGIPQIISKIFEKSDTLLDAAESLVREDESDDITLNIEEFRKEIETTLSDNNKKMIVFIDDLDRCLPDVALETLEAMRLLLFVKRTIFVIAADKMMIENAVASRFNISEESSLRIVATSYFDKLIETPINIPVIGQPEALVYLLSLMAEYYYKFECKRDNASDCVKKLGLSELLENSWKVDVKPELIQKKLEETGNDFLKTSLEGGNVIDSLAHVVPLLVKTESVSGNPRLLKRFLHTHILSKRIASQRNIMPFKQDMNLMLLTIERADFDLYKRINEYCLSGNGKIDHEFIEKEQEKGNELSGILELLKDDLRPYFYLSKVTASKILNDEDPQVSEVFFEIKEHGKQTASDSVKNAIEKLNRSQSEMLVTKLIQDAQTNGYRKLYFDYLLYIDSKMPLEKILSYIDSVPVDKMEKGDRAIIITRYKDNKRYDAIRSRLNSGK